MAQALNRLAAPRKPAPPLLFLTDPARLSDETVLETAARLPPGSGVILRTFGRAGALEFARRLRALTRAGGVLLLIGLDADLAEACGADGLHLPERALDQAPALHGAHPSWLITGAAHYGPALRRAEAADLDAVLLSPVFPSSSASATHAIGLARFSELVKACALPVYALGGVSSENAPLLLQSGAAGLAAIDGIVAEVAAKDRTAPKT